MSVRPGSRALVLLSLALSVSLLSMASMIACSDKSSDPGAPRQSSQQASEAPQTVADLDGGSSPMAVYTMDVYKSPTCGCCGKWVEHAGQHGFSLTTHHPQDLDKVKIQHGIAPQYQSCHTAVSGQGYVFEGHIPARYIREFLAAPPAGALGLAVPGMPVGSPGMAVGDRFMPYQVLLLKRDGGVEVFAEVSSLAQQYQEVLPGKATE